jgi:DNA-binding LacI/PurR family transcriptional regulator
MESAVNITQVAKLLGVSTGTVSRALNNRPEINSETRRRVLDMVAELGYAPNINAVRLMRGDNSFLAIECLNRSSVLSNAYLSNLIRAIGCVANDKGYDLLLRMRNSHARPLECITSVAGQILITTSKDFAEASLAYSRSSAVPTVVICDQKALRFSECSYVVIDAAAGVTEAVKYLTGSGHRRIGYVGSGDAGGDVRDVFLTVANQYGLVCAEDHRIEAGINEAGAFEATRLIMSRMDPPTAIFARTDVLAFGVIHALKTLGLSVPGDVSVLAYGDLEIGYIEKTPLTTIRVDIDALAQVAVTTLLDMVEEGAFQADHRVAPSLVIRETCGPVLATEIVSRAGIMENRRRFD